MPLLRTTTVQDVRDQWASLCGLDSTNVITDDATAFIEFLNLCFAKVWIKMPWSFATDVGSFSTDTDGKIDLSANSTIRDILDVYKEDILKNPDSVVYSYSINQNDVYVTAAPSTTVYLHYRTQETEFTSTLTTTLPYELKSYLSYQASADWLASEGQEQKSMARQAKAEEILMDLIDNFERQQQQTAQVRVGTRQLGVR